MLWKTNHLDTLFSDKKKYQATLYLLFLEHLLSGFFLPKACFIMKILPPFQSSLTQTSRLLKLSFAPFRNPCPLYRIICFKESLPPAQNYFSDTRKNRSHLIYSAEHSIHTEKFFLNLVNSNHI